jgi:6-pyruvoyl-tetrahydropterin synthase
VSPLDKIGPSSENIAATIYDALQPHFPGSPVKLVNVEVWESPTTGVAYSP